MKEPYIPIFFSLEELTRSSIAQRMGVNNEPSNEHRANLLDLIKNVLDPARRAWGKPIIVSSGYRSQAVNDAINANGGHASANSMHMKGLAADIQAKGGAEQNKLLFDAIAASNIPFHKMINEEGYRWIHISFDPSAKKPLRHLLDGVQGKYSIHKV